MTSIANGETGASVRTKLNAMLGGTAAVLSVSTTFPASGPAVGAVILDGGVAINAQSGTTYAIAGSDAAGMVVFSNAAGCAVSIAQAGTGAFITKWVTTLVNLCPQPVRLTPTTSTVNGFAYYDLLPGASCTLVSDGANYSCAGQAKTTTSQSQYYRVNGYIAGAPPYATSAAGVATAAGTMFAVPFQVGPGAVTISNGNLNITTLNVGGFVDIAIYDGNSGSTLNYITSLSAGIATDTTGNKTQALLASTQLQPGLYWAIINTSTAIVVYESITANSLYIGAVMGTQTLANIVNGTEVIGKQKVQAYGSNANNVATWPSTIVYSTFTDTTTKQGAITAFQIASMP